MIFLSTDSHDGKKIALLNMQLHIYLGQSLRKEDAISYCSKTGDAICIVSRQSSRKDDEIVEYIYITLYVFIFPIRLC
jgi:hypothetical protein